MAKQMPSTLKSVRDITTVEMWRQDVSLFSLQLELVGQTAVFLTREKVAERLA